MADARHILDAVRDALRSEPRIDLTHHPLALEWQDGDLTIEGEVADIAAKKLALERAGAAPGVRGIVDRLRVTPAQRMGDDQIRDHVGDALLEEPALIDCALRVYDKGQWVVARAPDAPVGTIDISVENGVVTLDGEVPGLARKRLAGVLAWWVPGSRDVVNGLGVTPPEEDNDDEITDAVRLALEKDPFVNPDQVRVSTANAVVLLQGQVATDSERDMAEFDAWYVFGVDRVVNRIGVRE